MSYNCIIYNIKITDFIKKNSPADNNIINEFVNDFFSLYDSKDKYTFSINIDAIAKWFGMREKDIKKTLNKSYIKNRNESVRNNFNAMISAYGNSSITNEQSNARIRLARKMARGNRVSYMNKVNAGIVKPIPKPTGPKPTKGGRKTRRVYRK